MNRILPEALPGAVGANPTEKERFCPEVRLNGVGNPETEKPGPEKLAELTDAVAVPALVKITDILVFDPTTTAPKLTGDGLALSCAVSAEIPVLEGAAPTPQPQSERHKREITAIAIVFVANSEVRRHVSLR